MPFDAISLELALFFGSLTILASLPTDQYFRPLNYGRPSYGAVRDPYRPPLLGGSDSRVEGRVFSAFGGPAEPRPPSRVVPPRDEWYRPAHGGGGSLESGPDLALRGRSEFQAWNSVSRRRSSEALAGIGYSDARNIENSYSSHVICETQNQKKSPTNVRENLEPVFGSPVGEKVETVVNLEESARDSRSGNSREGDVPNPRIVTPTGGRRSPQGSSPKNQNKPFNPGVTNAISTTEKFFGNQTTKASKKPRPSNSKPQGGGIVFPDGPPKKFVPRVSKCSKKSTFCEHVGEEYPTEYINQVLKKEGATFREFFGKDVISDPDIAERINGPEENSLCPFRQQVVFPRAAQNKEDKWLFIINQDQYVQGVTVEVCLNPESRCILTEGFPLGYTPYCKQKYIERRLVAIGEDGKPHSDSFRLPSCCSCVVKHESSAMMGLLRSSREVSEPPRR